MNDSLARGADFVLLDVRFSRPLRQETVPGAINLPHGKITRNQDGEWRRGHLRHLTAPALIARRGPARALRLARLGLPVKIMAGGLTGWIDEGFELQTGE